MIDRRMRNGLQPKWKASQKERKKEKKERIIKSFSTKTNDKTYEFSIPPSSQSCSHRHSHSQSFLCSYFLFPPLFLSFLLSSGLSNPVYHSGLFPFYSHETQQTTPFFSFFSRASYFTRSTTFSSQDYPNPVFALNFNSNKTSSIC